jgi:hypothetical protein
MRLFISLGAVLIGTACTGGLDTSSNESANHHVDAGGAGGGDCETWTVDPPKTIYDGRVYHFDLDDCVSFQHTTCAGDAGNTPPIPDGAVSSPPVDGGVLELPDAGSAQGSDKPSGADTDSDKRTQGHHPGHGNLRITSITAATGSIKVGQPGHQHGKWDAFITDGDDFLLRASPDGRDYHVNFVDDAGVNGTCVFHVSDNSCGH